MSEQMKHCHDCARFTQARICPSCSEETVLAKWVSTAVLWKPRTWGRGHWQFDYHGTGPTRWWNRFQVSRGE